MSSETVVEKENRRMGDIWGWRERGAGYVTSEQFMDFSRHATDASLKILRTVMLN